MDNIKTIDRDVSWMYFNHRILQEAKKKNIPILERLLFLGIYSNNLDEFYRVRVASLLHMINFESKNLKSVKSEMKKNYKDIVKLNSLYVKEYENTYNEILDDLRGENIFVVNEKELSEDQKKYICNLYHEKLSGYISPIWINKIKDLKKQDDSNIFFSVKMKAKGTDEKSNYAIIVVSTDTTPRFFELPSSDGKKYVIYIDDVIRFCLPFIFSSLSYDEYYAYSFKFTKDAEMEIDDDFRNGTLQKISKGIKSRRSGNPLRVVYDINMPKLLLDKVIEKLHIQKYDTVVGGGRYHNNKDLVTFPDCGRKDLKYPQWPSISIYNSYKHESLITEIMAKDRFVHVPYHDFEFYISLLQEAAIDPNVKSIKTTLYRLAKNSKVVRALINAAQNGKEVVVVIELFARFDEASNVAWSKKMQEAGVKVIFGVEGLKIHSKVSFIGINGGPDIACISTGNFHENNAKSYTDYLYFTSRKVIVKEVDKIFDFIRHPYKRIQFKELLLSPNDMRNKFFKLINTEIKNAKIGLPAYIKVKINHITDLQMINKIYQAASAGVKVDLLVRGCCCLVPDQKKLKGNVKINGIIDRYLEHSRIFIFANGGNEKYFLGSADWMQRNLDKRVEVVTPIYEQYIKEDLKKVIEFGLKDSRQARIVDGKGSNAILNPVDGFRSQEELYKHYLIK